MITSAEAAQRVLGEIPLLPTEICPLASAAGRVLREETVDPRPAPPFDRITMDGIAIAFQAWEGGQKKFRLLGTHPAGAPPPTLDDSSGCFEVMTGACLPHGCDTVIPVEECSFEARKRVTVTAPADRVKLGQYIHNRGSDHAPGQVLLDPGRVMGPREIAVAASAGCASLVVSTLPRVGIFSSGNELVEPGEPIENFQIFRSNAYALQAGLARYGRVTLSHAPDDESVIIRLLEEALATNDVLVISGGVSKGRFDYIHTALAKIGARKIFHGVQQRPGKPFWFGIAPGGKPIFALPGNPLSTLVCLHRYVLPALGKMAGMIPEPPLLVRLASPVVFQPPLTWYLPVKMRTSTAGTLEAEPRPPNTSGDYTSVLETNGFLELPAQLTEFQAGDIFPFFPWIGM